MGVPVPPPLVALHPPPVAAAKLNTPGCPMAPETAEIRPPRKGPMLRHCNPESSWGSTDCAGSEDTASGTTQSIRRDGARITESDESEECQCIPPRRIT